MIMPGHEATYATQPFHPLFLERLKPFTVLRFMDWGQTNDSYVSSWTQRRRPDYRTQCGEAGISYEVMADLCNATGKQLWVCVPHQATDDYVRQLATLLRDRLRPELKVFIEYSNEVWNGGFNQRAWVNGKAAALGKTWYQFYAQRSVEIFRLFETAFGGRTRLVRLLGSQTANPSLGLSIMSSVPVGSADALAIAPYFGGHLGNSANWQTTRTWTVTQVLDACAADVARQRTYMRANATNARSKGLATVAYEGGQHLAGVGTAASDATLTNLFLAANRSSRMGTIYRDYLAAWAAEGLGTFVHFTDVYTPGKWGSWGALETQDQPVTSAPKHAALVDVAAQWAATP
jgi:hypothetical protein